VLGRAEQVTPPQQGRHHPDVRVEIVEPMIFCFAAFRMLPAITITTTTNRVLVVVRAQPPI